MATSLSSCIPKDSGVCLFPAGLKDGPLPTHYEPLESPVGNMLYPEHVNQSRGQANGSGRQQLRRFSRPAFSLRPHDLSTHRASHRRRNVPLCSRIWRSFSQNCFVRFPLNSPRDWKFEHGDCVTIETPRGRIRSARHGHVANAPIYIDGQKVHQVGLAIPLGIQRTGQRRHRQRSRGSFPKSQMFASWKPRLASV